MIFMEKKSLIKFIGLILFLFILIYFFNFTEFGKDFKTQEGRLMQGENLEEFISGFGFLSPLVFIIIYAVLTALLFPGIILSFVGAVLFGVVNGTIYNLIGAVIGASLCFFISRLLGRRFVEGLFKNTRFYNKIEDNGFNMIFILRLLPMVPYNVLNFVSGVLKINFKDYFFASLFGMIPATFVYTYLFATLSNKVLFGEVGFKDLIQKDILIPLILFVLLMVLPLIFTKKIKKLMKRVSKN